MSGNGNDSRLAYGEMIDKLSPDDTDGKPAVLTVRSVREQDMAPRGSKNPDVKIIIVFAEEFEGDTADKKRREYVVNSTSYKTLCEKLGRDHNRWSGQQIVMAPTQTTYDGKTYDKLHVATLDRWDKTVSATTKAARKTTRR